MDLRDSFVRLSDFSISLAQTIIATDYTLQLANSNFVFSPPSINVVVGLIAAGSSEPLSSELLLVLSSKSADELKSRSSQLVTLQFADGEPLGGPRLSFANGVWVDRSLSIKPTFKETVEKVYRVAPNLADFKNKAFLVRSEVNAWAYKETRGLINEILPADSVDSSTKLLFVNAVYFKGAWNQKFDASETKDHEFFLLDQTRKTSVNVPFMTSKKEQYISAFDGFKVLGLPYAQGQDKRKFSMYFFLPDAKEGLDAVKGLAALTQKMASESGFIDRHLPSRQVKVGNFLVPKFKISYGFEVLKKMAEMRGPLHLVGFLKEMVDTSTLGDVLYVYKLFHKAFIEVNEEGTEAAADTDAVINLRSLEMEDKLDFVADHPFLFVLREDTTGVVLFVGQVLNPLAS